MGLCVECHGGLTIVDIEAIQRIQGIELPDTVDKAKIQRVFANQCDAELELYCRDNCPIATDENRACAAKILGVEVVRDQIAQGVEARIFILSATKL